MLRTQLTLFLPFHDHYNIYSALKYQILALQGGGALARGVSVKAWHLHISSKYWYPWCNLKLTALVTESLPAVQRWEYLEAEHVHWVC